MADRGVLRPQSINRSHKRVSLYSVNVIKLKNNVHLHGLLVVRGPEQDPLARRTLAVVVMVEVAQVRHGGGRGSEEGRVGGRALGAEGFDGVVVVALRLVFLVLRWRRRRRRRRRWLRLAKRPGIGIRSLSLVLYGLKYNELLNEKALYKLGKVEKSIISYQYEI